MTRLWTDANPIAVTADVQGVPVAFTWLRQRHRVDHVARHWRVDVDWWTQRVWRDYFKLATDTGLLVEIYCDLLTGQWHLQRLYD